MVVVFFHYRKRPNSLTTETFKEYKKMIEALLDVLNIVYFYVNNLEKEIYIDMLVFVFVFLRQIVINPNTEPQLDQEFYDKIRDTCILILDNIIKNKHLYNENILIQYINIIKHRDYLSFSEWIKKFRSKIVVPKETWYDKVLCKFF